MDCAVHDAFGWTIPYTRQRGIVPTLIRAGAKIDYDYRDAFDSSYARDQYMELLHPYLDRVRRAGGFAKYDKLRRAPFVAMLKRHDLPIPSDTVPLICEFWLRVGEY